MPIKRCQSGGKPGYKWGNEGKCYVYNPQSKSSETQARNKARNQGIAIGEFLREMISKIKQFKIEGKFNQEEFQEEIISFDYDETLTKPNIQQLAKEYISKNIKVLILTARRDSDMQPVYDLANELGIDKRNIHNTNGKDKWSYVIDLGITKHYDNSSEQIHKINTLTDAEGKLVK